MTSVPVVPLDPPKVPVTKIILNYIFIKIIFVLLYKLIAYSADNTNTNFGGRDRHGTNNVYFKLQSILSKDIEGIVQLIFYII